MLTKAEARKTNLPVRTCRFVQNNQGASHVVPGLGCVVQAGSVKRNPMTPPTTNKTREIHELCCRLTRQDMRYSMSVHYRWEVWLGSGYTVEDLTIVIAYIWKLIRAGQRKKESFKLSLLIGDEERFAEDLSMARAEARKPRRDAGRAQALRASGRAEDVPQRPARSTGEVLGERQKLAEWLNQWKGAHL